MYFNLKLSLHNQRPSSNLNYTCFLFKKYALTYKLYSTNLFLLSK